MSWSHDANDETLPKNTCPTIYFSFHATVKEFWLGNYSFGWYWNVSFAQMIIFGKRHMIPSEFK